MRPDYVSALITFISALKDVNKKANTATTQIRNLVIMVKRPSPPSTARKSPGCTEDYNIRLMPHGGSLLFPAILTTMAWLSSISTNGCDYSRFTGPGVEILTGSSLVPFIYLGMDAYVIPEFYPKSNLWMVSVESECVPYQYMLEDSSWTAGKRFDFLSLWSGGASAMILWMGTFLVLSPRQWKAVGILILFAALFQVLTFTWFGTSLCHTASTNIEEFQSQDSVGDTTTAESSLSSCSLFYGSRCSIASIFLYLMASFVILFREYPTPDAKLLAEESYQMVPMSYA